MSKTNIMNTLSRSLGKTKLGLKKHAPEILVITGVIGTVTSAVMACKATTKAGAIIDEMKDNMEKIHEVAESTEITNYSEEDMKKDTIGLDNNSLMKNEDIMQISNDNKINPSIGYSTHQKEISFNETAFSNARFWRA